jgi:VWFA-related protein
MTRRRVFALLGLVTFTALLHAQAPQPPPPTFHVSVDSVEVDVTVTDQKGNFVTGLVREDFELSEDDRPQVIENFSYVDVPAEPQDQFVVLGRPIRSDVQSNRLVPTGRVYLIVLDDLDVSPFRTAQVRKSAREFVEHHLSANDMAAVVCTSGRTDVAQEFTSDPILLLAAIDRFFGQRLRSAEAERIDEYYQLQNIGGDSNSGTTQKQIDDVTVADVMARKQSFDPSELERGDRAVAVLKGLSSLSTFLAGVHGRRKALLLFSEGIDYPMADVFNSERGTDISRATQDVLDAAARANVNIFSFDPRGLMGLTDDFVELSRSGSQNEFAGTEPNKREGQPYSGLQALTQEMALTQDSLRTLADGTGGFAVTDRNPTVEQFDRMVQANSQYYLLGYTPPAHSHDGQFHQVKVTVKRPGLKATTRRGYSSPSDRRPVETDLTSPIQQRGLGLSVQAAPFRQSATEASVALTIEVDGDRLAFAPQPGSPLVSDTVQISFFTLDPDGKAQHGTRLALNLDLRPDTYERVKALGVRAAPRLVLKPGRYELRISARDRVSGQVGSVFYDLTVPNYSKDPLMISGLLLSSESAEQVFTPEPDPTTGKLLPSPATSQRAFTQNDTLALLAEVYDNTSSRRPQNIEMNASLVPTSGLPVFVARDELRDAATETQQSGKTLTYTRRIPLKDVAPGRYLLRVDARVGSSRGAKAVAAETIITVAPGI